MAETVVRSARRVTSHGRLAGVSLHATGPRSMPFIASVSDDSPRAFPAHPRLDRFFGSASADAARERLASCLLRGDGPALLFGAPGVGKSMLVEVIARDVAGSLRVVRLASTQLCTRRALLQSILHGLDQPYRDREEGELRLALHDALCDKSIVGTGVALLVDEAQTLPTRLIEELRVLANTVVAGVPKLRLLLAGSHSLDESLTAPELEAFSQRIAARCYLEPLSRHETAAYVRAHIAAAGGDPDEALADDAYDAIALASDGLPRLINQVCDRAVVMAVSKGLTEINAATISDAWSDLHQLAAPWHVPSEQAAAVASAPATARSEPDTSTVEFGVLDEVEELVATVAESPQPTAVDTQPIWNADAGLRQLPTTDAPEPEDDGCVAYTFPVRPEEPAKVTSPPVEPPPARPAEPDAELPASDPFAESFDEEEVVLDPYAALERVIPGAPSVTTSEPSDIGQALDAWNEVTLDASVAVLEPPAASTGFKVVDHDDLMTHDTELDVEEEEVVSELVEPADDDEVLIIEPDEPDDAPAGDVRREDYGQLFASLRQE